ncbi:MAG: protein-disulfide reductase DsbD family protein [Gemmatimonadetes bacterium]|nr:protein-disulfide reductase DsbD family protein [Gemmatimonadota bacterium]
MYNLILFLAVVLCGQLYADDHPVKANFLADVDAVAPGQSFRLGIELTMEEKWHTYWLFSGDAGLPIEVEWQLPADVATGPLQWPLPNKFEEQGELVVYGYADEVLLMAEATAPQALAAGDTLHFGAEVSWLVCRELCIPGGASLTLALPVAAVGKPSAQQAQFDRYAAQVPGALDERIAVELAVRGEGAVEVDMRLSHEDKALEQGEQTPDFYPLEADGFALSTRRLAADHLVLSVEPYGDAEVDTLRGVLVYGLDGEVQAGTLALDLRAAPRQGGGILERDYRAASGEVARSLWVYIAFAVLGGLILNLMPCVLPVISLKVLGFVNQAGEETKRVQQLGWAFCAGIVATFLVLALAVLLVKSSGEQIGWGFQFQYPGFVVAMSALVFALALSLFGVYEILLPGTSNLGGIGGREGLTGSFLNGVLATILATPCTAPFLGTALGFAFAQPALVVVAVFLAIGVGMALPYVVLALKPVWIEHLPKPGPWMVRFKQLMGFLLMATVLWLLWVLGNQVGIEGVVWTGAFLLGLGLACWVWGQWGSFQHSTRSKRVARVVVLVLVVGSYAIFVHPLLAAEQTLAEQTTASELDWQPFSAARVEELVAGGQMVFIDFTAEWCWTCKVNEQAVLAQQVVRERFAALDVALVKADWTNRNPEITQLLRAFGRSGVPLYVIFPAGLIDQPLVLPEVITAEMVIDKLDTAAALANGN